MDLLNQAWKPHCDLLMLFDHFLPQLLVSPNNDDPLNADAAKLATENSGKFKVLPIVKRKACYKPFENTLSIPLKKATQ